MEEISDFVSQIKNSVITLGFILTSFVFLIGLIISKLLSNPIEDLRDAIEKVASGQLNQQSKGKG